MNSPKPLLILSDAPSAPTGLGRICRELAVRCQANLADACRVATFGYGGSGSRKFNFPQYTMEGKMDNWETPTLPDVWKDFAGDEAGVVLAIWDASRLGWFSRPNIMCEEPSLKSFLTSAKIERWIYCPIDAEGPFGKLSYPIVQSLLGFDRILAYGEWAEGVIFKSLGEVDALAAQERDLGSIPHGIDPGVFYPRDRASSRANFLTITGAAPLRGKSEPVLGDEPLVGTVATNQDRKDWGLWAAACSLFLSRHANARFWVHIDKMERDWSIPGLLVDFGLLDKTVISLGVLDDDQMAQAYTACDLTLGIGAGEGFGFPLAESLFCGTPVIHGNYAGAVDYLDDALLVDPIAFRVEGLYNCQRPIFIPKDWADKMNYLLGKRMNRPNQIDWENVWPRFDTWFRKGLRKFN
jgi:glycosyltransferase involved in cell wall biosynthesis